jgi:hypothetical protein
MKPPTFFNKVEILLYSTFISILSGINRLKAQELPISKTPRQLDPPYVVDTASVRIQEPGASASIQSESIQQALLSLVLWIILGLAAGFLIGMIKNG